MNLLKRYLPFLFFLISLSWLLKVLLLSYYPDFSSYYYGALATLQGGNPYLGGENFFGPYIYPPSALLFFFPFTFLSFFMAAKMFTALSLICFFVSIFLLFKIYKVAPFSALGLFLMILMFHYFPLKFTLGMGQINNIILLMVVLFLYFYAKKKEYLSGIFLAIAIALKVFPILLILYLIIDKQWKTLIATGITIVTISFLVYLFINPGVNLYFFEMTLPGLLNNWTESYYNQAITGFLTRGVDNTHMQVILKNVISAILTLVSFFFIWKANRKDNKTALLCIGMLISLSLIINPLSWQHHYVWLLIPLLVTFMFIKQNHLSIRFYAVLFISFLLVATNLKSPDVVPVLFQSHVLYGAVVLYFLNIYLLFRFDKLHKR